MEKETYRLSDFNFHLPDELVAQYPSDNREDSRLLHLDRRKGSIKHHWFRNLPELLTPGDLLVFNDTRVINVRVWFRRKSGGRVQLILIRKISPDRWTAISNRTSRLRINDLLISEKDPSVEIEITGREENIFTIRSRQSLSDELLEEIGEIPLPPYIKRTSDERDRERYQTVYARSPGSAAAPTAGLHFTRELLDQLTEKGVEQVFCTLDVSWGTFQPVRSENLRDHKMHSESYNLSPESAGKINRARKEGRRIIPVGTTSVRVLESSFREGENIPGEGETDIFIYPPYSFQSINGLITNFHTPGSTLLMLVSAFAGYTRLMEAYGEAIARRYRFFSYGDSMIIT